MDLLSSGKSVPIAEPADPLVAGAASTAAATQLPAGLVVVRIRGEVTSSSWTWIATVLASSPECLLIDLTSVVFFCSAGISEMRTLRRRCADSAVDLRLVAPGRVRRPLELVGLRGLFTSSEKPDDAVADVLAGKKNLPRTPGHRPI